ncbi:Pentatricopeptide repeat-containing protein At3g02490, mitochondrial [Linum grandiflorum]
MRHSWRLLLLRTNTRSSLSVSSISPHLHRQVSSSCSPYLSSLRTLPSYLRPFSGLPSSIHSSNVRHFSSESVVERPSKDSDPDPELLAVSNVFTNFSDVGDISREMETNGVVVSHDLVLKVLKSLQSNPDAAQRFFGWVLDKDAQKLSSKSYNWMLGILGTNGCTVEFWDLVETMAKKGYGMSKVTHDRAKEKFEKEGLKKDLAKLNTVFASGSIDDSMEKLGVRIGRIVRNNVWSEDVEKQIKELNVSFSAELVMTVVDSLAMDPMKALIFFRWVDESGLYNHGQRSYNAIARILGREDCNDRFWKVTDEMKSKGYEMEDETFDKVLARFVKRKMNKEAVDLYEFAMKGKNKPSSSCCVFILRKILAAKQLDIGLFSRVVKIYTRNGNNALTDSMLDTVLKTLTSVGRFEDCNKILKEMEESGFTAGGNLQSKIAFRLGSSLDKKESSAFVDQMEATGGGLDSKAWLSLIKGHCTSGDLETASSCFKQMASKQGITGASYAFESLVNAYCNKNRAADACKLLHECVSQNQLKPLHTTYKLLIRKLLSRHSGFLFKDALSVVNLMRSDGFPPFVEPCLRYLSEQGTGDDGVEFMKATTSKKFPATPLAIRVFEGYMNAGRRGAAQDLLSKCPDYIRSHADVLNLFTPVKHDGATADVSVAA